MQPIAARRSPRIKIQPTKAERALLSSILGSTQNPNAMSDFLGVPDKAASATVVSSENLNMSKPWRAAKARKTVLDAPSPRRAIFATSSLSLDRKGAVAMRLKRRDVASLREQPYVIVNKLNACISAGDVAAGRAIVDKMSRNNIRPRTSCLEAFQDRFQKQQRSVTEDEAALALTVWNLLLRANKQMYALGVSTPAGIGATTFIARNVFAKRGDLVGAMQAYSESRFKTSSALWGTAIRTLEEGAKAAHDYGIIDGSIEAYHKLAMEMFFAQAEG